VLAKGKGRFFDEIILLFGAVACNLLVAYASSLRTLTRKLEAYVTGSTESLDCSDAGSSSVDCDMFWFANKANPRKTIPTAQSACRFADVGI